MNKRWILALTAVVGLGLLAVPLFVRSRPPQATTHRRDQPGRSAVDRFCGGTEVRG